MGATVAAALSDGAVTLGGVGLPWFCAAIAFAVQWVAFVPAMLRRTESFYDLVGSLTYVGVIAFALVASGARDPRSALLAGLVWIWAARLGLYLFIRARRHGDSRFDEIKRSPADFLVAWTVQGLWVLLTASPAVAAIATVRPAPPGVWTVVGAAVWLGGFAIEVVADRQKSVHRARHPGRFIRDGLWAWSRHPNYFGEIVLWVGVATIASETLSGWQWIAWISPLFVTVLLTRVSGIPMLERKAEERWGSDPEFRAYRRKTPVLIPRPPRR